MKPLRSTPVVWALLVSAFVVPRLAAGRFVEPDVDVIRLLSGEQDGDYFGWIAANVGDLNGDGVDEVLVPAIAFDGFAGRVTLFSGMDGSVLNDVVGAPGTALGYTLGAAGDVDGDGTGDYIAGGGQILVFSGADHHMIHDLSAVAAFSDGVHGAGDVDGDGHADLVIGEQNASFAAPNAGRVSVVSGADGSVLWVRDGAAEGDLLGSAVGAVGDVDHDQVPDIVVGSSGAGPFDGGRALVLSGVDGAVIHTLQPAGEKAARQFGAFFASGAGDFDRDGVGDIYIGDFDAGLGEREHTGAAYIFSGRTGRRIHVLRGLEPGETFGLGRGIEDVNGDGVPEILVGAINNSEGAPAAGATYLFSGRSGALLRTITATLANDNFGGDVISASDVDGDRLPDFLMTAPGLSFSGVDHGRAYVIAGSVLPCPADLTGDDWVGLHDFLRVRRAFGATEGPADLNGDGKVNVRDLVVLIRDAGWCAPGHPR